MTTMDIKNHSAYELGKLIKTKKLSSPELTRYYLDAAKQDYNKDSGDETKINAFTEILEESAIKTAAEVQKKIDAGENLSPLSGVPMVLKDNICTVEGYTTAASKILSGYRSPFDADSVERLNAAGAVIIGKTNMDEFAMGSSNEKSCYGPVRNPLDLSLIPGGSSGGSAAAVAAGFAAYALGSDTGGSVRQPCSFTGLTGIKPTYGSVSRYGLIAHASSMDQIGPMAKDARDASIILSIISGRDERDSTSLIDDVFRPCGIVHPEPDTDNLKGKTIGIPHNYFELPELSEDIKTCVLNAAETMQMLGAEIRDITLPPLKDAYSAHAVLACAEAVSNLACFDGVKCGFRAEGANTIEEVYAKTRGEGFGAEVKRRLLIGYYVLSEKNYDTYFRQAQRVRSLVSRAYDKALESCDFILTPVSPFSPYKIGAKEKDSLKPNISDIYLVPSNLTGMPAATAPCGKDKSGMPIGMQLIGKPFSDMDLLHALWLKGDIS